MSGEIGNTLPLKWPCAPMAGTAPLKVGIIEDQSKIREGLRSLIDGTDGYRCVCSFGSMEEALAKIDRELPDVLLQSGSRVLPLTHTDHGDGSAARNRGAAERAGPSLFRSADPSHGPRLGRQRHQGLAQGDMFRPTP